MFHRYLITFFISLTLSTIAFSKEPTGETVATTSVVYGKTKDGCKKTGILTLIMTEGKTVKFQDKNYFKGKFALHLETHEAQDKTTPLNPITLPLTAGGELFFPKKKWPIVTHDFNHDGISEFNLSQPGNSWGSHFMLFTFAKDGSGKIEAMAVDPKKEFNYLHPQTTQPSTHYLLETKNGFKHLFTERGDIEDNEVYIYYYWSSKTQEFREQKRVPID